MANLLILGDTIDPRRQIVARQDRLLRGFLKAFEKTKGVDSAPEDNPFFWFEQPEPYYPFKTRPVPHHRVSHASIIGLAELILEQEAASVGVSSQIMPVDRVLDIQGRLKNPALFDRYDMLALSTTYILPAFLFFLLRSIPNHVKIFIGGPGAGKVKDSELYGIRFDYLLRSEAEGRFHQLLLHAMGKAVELTRITGLTWREAGRLFHSTQKYTPVDLDAVPLPDFDKMARVQQGRVVYESARGCPFRCEFCDYPFLMGNRKFRYKSAERIFQDWQVMHASMGVRDILCLDSLFTYPPKRFKRLCDLLCQSGLNKKLRWGCYARPDDLADPDIARLMGEAGCMYVYAGFESGSQQVLNFMNKKCTVQNNRNALANCFKFGIMPVGLFITGFPGETPEMFQETKAFLRETPPFMISVAPWMPDLAEGSKVPVMQPDRLRQFDIHIEYPSAKKITLWRNSRFNTPLSIPWGYYWTHCGMSLQEAWDLIGDVIEEIYEGKIKAMAEEFFLPRLLDDPLNLYCRLGPHRAIDFYLSLSKMVVDDNRHNFYDWCRKVRLICEKEGMP
ncbi:MAG: radical SAM protein [bacterium]|nr:radical SAM protein [bacterium]